MKIIIRIPNWVGDAVMALPALEAARKIFASDHIAIMGRQAVAPVFKNHPAVDQLHVIADKDSLISGSYRAGMQIKSDRFDLGIVLPPSLSSAVIFKLGKVQRRIGYIDDGRKIFLTDGLAYPAGKSHRSEQYLHLINHASGRESALKSPRLFITEEENDAAEQILSKEGINRDNKFICVAPRAVAVSRRWGSENYGELSSRLTRQLNCRILLLGTSDDFLAGKEAVAKGGDSVVNLCGRTSLMTAAAILTRAALFIGNDSGLGHLAAAAGAPVVILSGADNPAETSPLSANKKVIIKDIDCISCIKNRCPEKGERYMRCMKLITVDEVFDAAREICK